MTNRNQECPRVESNVRTDNPADHHARELSRSTCADLAVVVDTGARNTCHDVLPQCQFAPMTEKEQRQAYVREIAAPLFEGSPPLMSYLDRSSYKGNNREFDGRVSVHNMHDFLKTYETMNATGEQAWPYTEKNAQYVRDLLDFKYPELTGEDFAGFSAKALCRRAGLTKVRVKDYEGYAPLAEAWKQAVNDDASFRRDAHNANGIPLDAVPPDAPPTRVKEVAPTPCDPPVVQDKPCEPPAKKPCETPDPYDDSVKEHDRNMRSQIERMSTFENGGSYWRMAKTFLHAGMKPGDKDDITNRDVAKVTKSFLEINHSHTDSRGLPVPMVHPGDRVPIPEHLAELAARHEKLARALERMMSAEQ